MNQLIAEAELSYLLSAFRNYGSASAALHRAYRQFVTESPTFKQ